MRNISMVSTKDHFLIIVSCDSAGEEIWSEPTGQVIGFLANGSFASFSGNEESWSKHSDSSAPCIRTRPADVSLGWVASSDGILNISVIPKELSVSGTWGNFTPLLANTSELNTIEQNTNTAFVIAEQCFNTPKRDINTFSLIDPLDSNDIPESEITIV